MTVIKAPPGYRYFDNRPTRADAIKLGKLLEKQGYIVGFGKGKTMWHVFVRTAKNPQLSLSDRIHPTKTQLSRWKQLEKVFGERKPTRKEREEAWKQGMVM